MVCCESINLRKWGHLQRLSKAALRMEWVWEGWPISRRTERLAPRFARLPSARWFPDLGLSRVGRGCAWSSSLPVDGHGLRPRIALSDEAACQAPRCSVLAALSAWMAQVEPNACSGEMSAPAFKMCCPKSKQCRCLLWVSGAWSQSYPQGLPLHLGKSVRSSGRLALIPLAWLLACVRLCTSRPQPYAVALAGSAAGRRLTYASLRITRRVLVTGMAGRQAIGLRRSVG